MSRAVNELLLRQLNEAKSPALWLVDENLAEPDFANLRPNPSLHIVSNRCDIASTLQAKGFPVTLNDFDLAALEQDFEQVIYRVSKERNLVHHCINESFKKLKVGGSLFLFGEKNEGIKTHAKHSSEVFGSKASTQKVGLAYIVEAEKTKETAAGELETENYPELRSITIGDFSFTSKPGLYGWNKVDQGSELLLAAFREAYPPGESRFESCLDLGCGYGYLLLKTADYEIERRVATDNNVAAILAAKENFDRANLDVDSVLADCGDQVSGRFSLVLCNPPFHQGFDHHKPLTEKFLKATSKLLTPKGVALFVVNQFVALEKAALPFFQQLECIADNGSFRVFLLKKS